MTITISSDGWKNITIARLFTANAATSGVISITIRLTASRKPDAGNIKLIHIMMITAVMQWR